MNGVVAAWHILELIEQKYPAAMARSEEDLLRNVQPTGMETNAS